MDREGHENHDHNNIQPNVHSAYLWVLVLRIFYFICLRFTNFL